jgi:hypothetical protein
VAGGTSCSVEPYREERNCVERQKPDNDARKKPQDDARESILMIM